MKHNIRRELASAFVGFVAKDYPDEILSAKVMAPMFNELYAEMLQAGQVDEDPSTDFCALKNGRLMRVHGILANYRDVIIQHIQDFPEQDKVRNLRAWFLNEKITSPPSTMKALTSDVHSLRKALADQNELILEQALQVEELQKAVVELRAGLNRLLSVQTSVPRVEAPKPAESHVRYHIHGLLARQQQEIKKRFPHLNLTFSEDTVNLNQLSHCRYVFAMTNFLQQVDEQSMKSQVKDRYVRVSGGLSSLIAKIKEMAVTHG